MEELIKEIIRNTSQDKSGESSNLSTVIVFITFIVFVLVAI